MARAENVILFDAFFLLMLSLFGPAVTPVNPLTQFQAIPQPALAPLPPGQHCSPYDFVCNGSAGIVTATAYVGWAIVNLPVLIVYLIIVVVTFLNAMLQIVFSPTFGANGVPILGFIFVAFQIEVLFEVFRMFRGSSSGL